ncbi:MAG TPA: sigma-70 family RNA polymerase sigma factor [Spirochaetota bacterium]|nr:sigma-70 family RNA polymerase sigma factor [Spirochaetota bacterium]HPS87768.1 sigma-70 family RNA polymerase sigma factor [Spirochaetota bacterium]
MKNSYDSFDEKFEKIYRNNYLYLVKYLFLFVHDFNIAEDLAHDIFLRIYKSKNAVITGDQIRNYLKIAARNIAIDHLRKQSREEAKNKKIIPELKEYDEAFYSSLENSVIEGEVMSTVNDVLDNFTERGRKIFLSRIMEHKTRKKVSEEEDISLYTVKRIENEILYKLRAELKQYL